MRKKISGFLGFSGSPGSRTFFENPRDRDPEHLCKNPRDFYIPGIGIFFRGMGNPDKKPPLVTPCIKFFTFKGADIKGCVFNFN